MRNANMLNTLAETIRRYFRLDGRMDHFRRVSAVSFLDSGSLPSASNYAYFIHTTSRSLLGRRREPDRQMNIVDGLSLTEGRDTFQIRIGRAALFLDVATPQLRRRGFINLRPEFLSM